MKDHAEDDQLAHCQVMVGPLLNLAGRPGWSAQRTPPARAFPGRGGGPRKGWAPACAPPGNGGGPRRGAPAAPGNGKPDGAPVGTFAAVVLGNASNSLIFAFKRLFSFSRDSPFHHTAQ